MQSLVSTEAIINAVRSYINGSDSMRLYSLNNIDELPNCKAADTEYHRKVYDKLSTYPNIITGSRVYGVPRNGDTKGKISDIDIVIYTHTIISGIKGELADIPGIKDVSPDEKEYPGKIYMDCDSDLGPRPNINVIAVSNLDEYIGWMIATAIMTNRSVSSNINTRYKTVRFFKMCIVTAIFMLSESLITNTNAIEVFVNYIIDNIKDIVDTWESRIS